MADIELVIKIDEDVYKARQHWITNQKRMVDEVDIAIANGTPLPKCHGRLKDVDEILKAMNTCDKFGFDHTGCFVREPKDDFVTYVHYEDMVKAVRCTQTIIEADKEKSEVKE